MPAFSQSLETALHRALEYANERHHEYATLEHLLLSLLDDRDAAAVMKACSVDLDELKARVTEYLDNELSSLFVKGSTEAQPTTGFQRVIHRAVVHVQSSGREEVTGANVLVAIFAERESHAAFFLQEQEMTRFDAVQYISHGIAKRPGMSEPRHVRGVDEDTGTEKSDEKKQPQDALNSYCVNLNKKAKNGRIDPLIGREPEVMRTIQVLCRRQKNNPLFVGDPGVGKTAIAEGLARKIILGEVPEVLRDLRSSPSIWGPCSPVRYRGDFEERLKAVMKEIENYRARSSSSTRSHGDRRRATSGGAMDASNLLKPALQSGTVRCIGSTTYKEYRQHFEKDRALVRRFQKIDIKEPTVEDSIEILRGLKPYFEEYHKLKYTNEAVKAAVELSAKYIHDRKLPDKAIDVIDETGASQLLVPEAKRKKKIGVKEVEATVAPWRAFRQRPSPSRRRGAGQHQQDMKALVFGQDRRSMLATRSALARGPADRAIGCYLFSGPTGVGKTGSPSNSPPSWAWRLRFDMSNYMGSTPSPA